MDKKESSSPRFIDTIESAQNATPVKVIILSASRTGTLSLYKGLKVLGYKPYHMVEVCAAGVDHLRIFHEYVRLGHMQSGVAKPYARPEFDKWFKGFDAICEIPSYGGGGGGTAFVDAYIDDPNVKFILTDRSPKLFSRSIQNTVGQFVRAGHSFPLVLLKHLDMYNWEFFSLVDDMYRVYTQGKWPQDPGSDQNIERWYEQYTMSIRKHVPPERLLYVRLEDGLGWEQVCPYLGVEIPDTPYPRGNLPDEFKGIAQGFLGPGIKKAIGIVAASVVAVAGTAAWWMYPRHH